MSADPKSVINLGLGKIGATLVSSIAPPKSPLEKHCAIGYPTWRDTELEKRDWTFALTYEALTLSGTVADVAKDGRIYKFAIPTTCIKPIRDKFTTWEQRGLFLYDTSNTLTLPFTKRVTEAEFTGLFTDVMACRVACECVEYATQSNTKGETAQQKYAKAVSEAAKANAFRVGPQDIELADENSEWVQARMGNHE